ncbi:MAG: hypothetical protein HRU20_02660 [Pseudomonadales bacterium]|nr:hypothetical protein [Pseudomonadales bacterium]
MRPRCGGDAGKGFYKSKTTTLSAVEIRRMAIPGGIDITSSVSGLRFNSRGFIESASPLYCNRN